MKSHDRLESVLSDVSYAAGQSLQLLHVMLLDQAFHLVWKKMSNDNMFVAEANTWRSMGGSTSDHELAIVLIALLTTTAMDLQVDDFPACDACEYPQEA